MHQIARFDSDPSGSEADDDVQNLRELVKFAEEIERTPLPSLIAALPGIADESDEKLKVATRVIRQRYATLPLADREAISEIGKQVVEGSENDLSSHLRYILS